jgi:Holliday junction resolvasome RuvABC endonuclease subunit
VLAIERPFLGYGNRSTLLVVVAREIKQLARKQRLEVTDVNPKTAKRVIAGNGSATKRDVARLLCSRYPELRIYLGQTHKYKEKYWQNMFDAVSVGLTVVLA